MLRLEDERLSRERERRRGARPRRPRPERERERREREQLMLARSWESGRRNSFLLLVVMHLATNSFLLLVAMHLVTTRSSFLLQERGEYVVDAVWRDLELCKDPRGSQRSH